MQRLKQNGLRLSLALGCWALGLGVAAPWSGVAGAPAEATAFPMARMTLSGAAGVFGLILGKNLLVAVLLIGGGLVSAGVFTAAGLVYNGVLLGMIVRHALASGMGAAALVVGLAFHGPVEVFAFSLAGAFGFRGARLARRWVGTGELDSSLLPSLRALGLIAGLLLCAALLETSALAFLQSGYVV